MLANLDALLTALYVRADDLLPQQPEVSQNNGLPAARWVMTLAMVGASARRRLL